MRGLSGCAPVQRERLWADGPVARRRMSVGEGSSPVPCVGTGPHLWPAPAAGAAAAAGP